MTIGQIVVAIVLVAAAATVSVNADELCQFQSRQIYPVAPVQACVHSVPFSEKVRTNTLNSLSQSAQLYAFLDIASNPPPSGGLDLQAVDLLAEFEKMRTKAYATDFDFHYDLTALFRRLYDAHTMYRMPDPYRSFYYWQPLKFISYVENGQQLVVVTNGSVTFKNAEYYKEHLGIDLEAYSGATVLTIDGAPAIETLIKFSHSGIGLSKDVGTRLNLALAQVEPTPSASENRKASIDGLFSLRDGAFSELPTADSVSYTFKLLNGSTVSIRFPWLVTAAATFAGQSDFMSHYWASPEAENNLIKPSTPFKPTWSFDPLAPMFSKLREQRKSFRHELGGNPDFPVLLESYDVHFYRIAGDDRTVVLYIDTFGPDNTTAFMNTVSEGLAQAAALGLDRLILDFTQNGGGDICLGVKFINYLFDDQHPFPPTDLPQSELAITMAKRADQDHISGGMWSADTWVSYEGQNFTDSSWLIPGINRVRGGKTRGHSQLIHLSDEACSYNGNFPVKPKKISQVRLVTHGFCGSTCALVSNHAVLYDKVQAVVVGGIMGRDQQYSSFPGGQVMDTPALWSAIGTYFRADPNNALIPPPLLTTGSYRFCIREIYPDTKGETPMEYLFQKAQYHVDNTLQTALHPEYVWPKVATFFDK